MDAVLLLAAVILIVLALVYFLVATIFALKKIADGLDETITAVVEIIEKSAPVNDVVGTINTNLDAAVDALEGLLVKKAGMVDAVGLVDGLYPGAAKEGFRNFEESKTVKAPRISTVYTRGTLTLARLGREAPIAVAEPGGRRAAGRPSTAATPPASSTSATGPAARRSSAPIRQCNTRRPMQTPAPFEYERATSLDGAIASLKEHENSRIIAGGHSLLPMMKLRLATPSYLIDINDLDRPRLHPRGGRRAGDRGADPPRRVAAVRRAVRALPGVPRRRRGDRRPGRPQPRHDRRFTVSGRRRRRPVSGVLRAARQGEDPRR